jgi:hypothetical protein
MRILNTPVWRGLPGERTELAPTVTEYIKRIYEQDEFLQNQGLVLPGEIAGINYDHSDFADIDNSPYQHHELLGAIWRESIYTFLEEDEQAITLSALMHVDSGGVPYISRLVEESGLTLDEWLEEFLDIVLPPLLHFLYRYGTVFSPHGQNTILVVEDGVPTRLAVKDFADDVNVSDQPLAELEALPDEMHDVLRKEPPEGLCQFIFCGLFVCVFRYVVDVLEEHEDYPEEQFWMRARNVILDYQARFPDLEERFELFDLLQPEFTKLSLNRNRIFDYGYDDAPGRPHASEYGTVTNALHEVADECGEAAIDDTSGDDDPETNDFGEELGEHETKGGYNRYDVSSLLQKAVRRSDEECAAWTAWELTRSGYAWNLWDRLALYVVEDLRAGDEIVLLLHRYEQLATERWDTDDWEGRLCAIHAALAAARATSTREATYLPLATLLPIS